MAMVETTIFHNYELNFSGWVSYHILKLGLGYNDVKCQTPSCCSYVQGWVLEKHPPPQLCILAIFLLCRIASPHHLFFEDCLHQSSTSSSLPLQPQTDQSVQETSTSFTSLIRNPSLGWSAVGASRDFVYHSSKLRADQKSQSLILGSSEVGKLGSVDGTASVWQLQRWGRVASWHRERGGAHKP